MFRIWSAVLVQMRRKGQACALIGLSPKGCQAGVVQLHLVALLVTIPSTGWGG